MRKLLDKLRSMRSKLIYVAVSAVLISAVFTAMINYIYQEAEDNGFENLHMQTKEIKDDIELQMFSDRENLSTMAGFASKLYSDGGDYSLLLNSFKAIGLIENIGILMPDNKMVTKLGIIDAPDDLRFEQEAEKGEYISGKVKDATNSGREVIRSAVPIISKGKTVAMLYGIIEFKTLENRYKQKTEEKNAQLFVIRRETGNFIIDTIHNELGNVSSLSTRQYKKDFSYEKLSEGILSGKSGYSSFVSSISGETMYIHYSPINVSDWQIMLAMPEKIVFSEAKHMGVNMFVAFTIIVLIMSLCLTMIFASEKRSTKMYLYASRIRKLLLEINQQDSSIKDALQSITLYSKSRSAFFVDTEGEEYNYIIPLQRNKLLSGDDRKYFVEEILNYAKKKSKNDNVSVALVRLSDGAELEKDAPELCRFFRKHGIRNAIFAGISSRNNHVSVLGVVNSTRFTGVRDLLSEIAICFSMAIHNKKYLHKTEYVASTDSLTGLLNRMAYKKDIALLDDKQTEKFSCIYIDVNELHIINNKYGHNAGDGMLLYIAKTLKEVFVDARIYRIGGDEFLLFNENLEEKEVNDAIAVLHEKCGIMNYHVSVGVAFRDKNTDTDAAVSEAEKHMYEAKAQYYHQKEMQDYSGNKCSAVEHIATGIRDVDAILSIMGRHYQGVYGVSLKTDIARPILMPEYLKKYMDIDCCFSRIYSQYIHDLVSPDYHRPLLSFLQYDVLRRELAEGHTPSITYEKTNGGRFRISVYALSDKYDELMETIWVFEREIE